MHSSSCAAVVDLSVFRPNTVSASALDAIGLPAWAHCCAGCIEQEPKSHILNSRSRNFITGQRQGKAHTTGPDFFQFPCFKKHRSLTSVLLLRLDKGKKNLRTKPKIVHLMEPARKEIRIGLELLKKLFEHKWYLGSLLGKYVAKIAFSILLISPVSAG